MQNTTQFHYTTLLRSTGGGFLTASKQFIHGATSKSRSNTASNSTKHKSPHLSEVIYVWCYCWRYCFCSCWGGMSKLFGGGQKAASGGIQGDVLATDNNTVGMGDAGIKSAIQGSNVPNPDEAVPSFVSGAMAKAGKGLLEGTLQAGTSAVSDKLLDLVGLGGKSAADKGKDTRD